MAIHGTAIYYRDLYYKSLKCNKVEKLIKICMLNMPASTFDLFKHDLESVKMYAEDYSKVLFLCFK